MRAVFLEVDMGWNQCLGEGKGLAM